MLSKWTKRLRIFWVIWKEEISFSLQRGRLDKLDKNPESRWFFQQDTETCTEKPRSFLNRLFTKQLEFAQRNVLMLSLGRTNYSYVEFCKGTQNTLGKGREGWKAKNQISRFWIHTKLYMRMQITSDFEKMQELHC